MITVAVVDIPGTNKRNLLNCLQGNVDVNFVDTPDKVNTDTLILPGVSNFGHYIDFLDSHGWREFLLKTKRKVIGICAGYHALCEGSEESPLHIGLGLLQGQAKMIIADLSCSNGKVPHVGLRTMRSSTSLLLESGYFIHSFGILADKVSNETQVITVAKQHYAVSQVKNNIIGMQYHPELSGQQGKRMLLSIINN